MFSRITVIVMNPKGQKSELHLTPLEICLQDILCRPNCVKTEWIQNPLSDINLCRMHVSDYGVDSLYWINERNEKLSFVFPAILNFKGVYNRIEPHITVRDNKMVR